MSHLITFVVHQRDSYSPMYPDRLFSPFSPHFLILRLFFPLLPLLIKAKRASSIDFIFFKDASENLILTWLACWLWLGLFMSLQPVLYGTREHTYKVPIKARFFTELLQASERAETRVRHSLSYNPIADPHMDNTMPFAK
ncbi:MAG: hypothetical protein JOS17DRAFT_744505 [Linnemannia elongata]|nr:MAG: hypothetical protein JOS17DRAFT_744505 [Linnemannia elongata]